MESEETLRQNDDSTNRILQAINEMRQETRQQIGELRQEMQRQIGDLRQETRQQVQIVLHAGTNISGDRASKEGLFLGRYQFRLICLMRGEFT